MGCVSLVFQDVHLFRASMLENIRMARPGATREEVVEAARAAQADTFIRALPQGYDTVYGSEGVHLSGGEAQRVSIARAILADRARRGARRGHGRSRTRRTSTSFQKAFERLMAGKTVIMIAHPALHRGGRRPDRRHRRRPRGGAGPARGAARRARHLRAHVGALHAGPLVGHRVGKRRTEGRWLKMAAPNRIPRLQRALALTDQGYRGLKRAIAACTLTNLALMVPFAITVMAFGVVLMRLTGGGRRLAGALGPLRRGRRRPRRRVPLRAQRLSAHVRDGVPRDRGHAHGPRRAPAAAPHVLLQPTRPLRAHREPHGGRLQPRVAHVEHHPAARRQLRLHGGSCASCSPFSNGASRSACSRRCRRRSSSCSPRADTKGGSSSVRPARAWRRPRASWTTSGASGTSARAGRWARSPRPCAPRSRPCATSR